MPPNPESRTPPARGHDADPGGPGREKPRHRPSGERPSVSVVIPAYNCGRYVETAIRSILAQTCPVSEILVVDDGSTDDTVEVVEGLARSFPDVIRLVRQPNSGSAVARNRGVAMATGEYVAFLDADDFWFPEKTAAQVEHLLAHPEIGLVYCAWKEWHPGAEPPSFDSLPERGFPLDQTVADCSGWIYPRLLMECAVWTSAVMARRTLLEQVGEFDPALRRGQDYDYWLRCSQQTPVAKLARVMALYRILPDSITRRPHAQNYEFMVLDKSLRRWGRRSADGRSLPPRLLRQRLFSTWYYFAAAQFHAGAFGAAVRAICKGLAHRPYDPRGLALLAEAAFRGLTSSRRA